MRGMYSWVCRLPFKENTFQIIHSLSNCRISIPYQTHEW